VNYHEGALMSESKAEYSALSSRLAHVARKKKLKQTNASAPLIQ